MHGALAIGFSGIGQKREIQRRISVKAPLPAGLTALPRRAIIRVAKEPSPDSRVLVGAVYSALGTRYFVYSSLVKE
jgi:hypothetical protein